MRVATRVRGYRSAGEPRRGGSGTAWKGRPQTVKARYAKPSEGVRRHLSRPGHEESWLNYRGPSRKAKYYRETDRGRVP